MNAVDEQIKHLTSKLRESLAERKAQDSEDQLYKEIATMEVMLRTRANANVGPEDLSRVVDEQISTLSVELNPSNLSNKEVLAPVNECPKPHDLNRTACISVQLSRLRI